MTTSGDPSLPDQHWIDLDALSQPRPFPGAITRYKLVESPVEDDVWRIYIKAEWFGWRYLTTRSGIERATNYVARDREQRSPR